MPHGAKAAAPARAMVQPQEAWKGKEDCPPLASPAEITAQVDSDDAACARDANINFKELATAVAQMGHSGTAAQLSPRAFKNHDHHHRQKQQQDSLERQKENFGGKQHPSLPTRLQSSTLPAAAAAAGGADRADTPSLPRFPSTSPGCTPAAVAAGDPRSTTMNAAARTPRARGAHGAVSADIGTGTSAGMATPSDDVSGGAMFGSSVSHCGGGGGGGGSSHSCSLRVAPATTGVSDSASAADAEAEAGAGGEAAAALSLPAIAGSTVAPPSSPSVFLPDKSPVPRQQQAAAPENGSNPHTPAAAPAAGAGAGAALPFPTRPSLSPADNAESPAPSAPWLVQQALSVKAAVEEAVRGAVPPDMDGCGRGAKGEGEGEGEGGGDGTGGAGDSVPDVEVEEKGRRGQQELGGPAGPGGWKRDSAVFPDKVIAKVPRLVADLHSALGCGVSTSEAKAWVCALGRLGEGLSREKLLEACLDVSRDVFRLVECPGSCPLVPTAAEATPGEATTPPLPLPPPRLEPSSLAAPAGAAAAAIRAENTVAEEAPAALAAPATLLTPAAAVTGARGNLALDTPRWESAPPAAPSAVAVDPTLTGKLRPGRRISVTASTIGANEGFEEESWAEEDQDKGEKKVEVHGLRLGATFEAAATPRSLTKEAGAWTVIRGAGGTGASPAAAAGAAAAAPAAAAAAAVSACISPITAAAGVPHASASAATAAAPAVAEGDARVAVSGLQEPDQLLWVGSRQTGSGCSGEVTAETGGSFTAAKATVAGEARARGSDVVNAARSDSSLATSAGHGRATAKVAGKRSATKRADTARYCGCGDGGGGGGGGGGDKAGARHCARRNASKFPDDVIAKVPRLSTVLNAAAGRYVSLHEVKDTVRLLRRSGAGMDSQTLLDGCLELMGIKRAPGPCEPPSSSPSASAVGVATTSPAPQIRSIRRVAGSGSSGTRPLGRHRARKIAEGALKGAAPSPPPPRVFAASVFSRPAAAPSGAGGRMVAAAAAAAARAHTPAAPVDGDGGGGGGRIPKRNRWHSQPQKSDFGEGRGPGSGSGGGKEGCGVGGGAGGKASSVGGAERTASPPKKKKATAAAREDGSAGNRKRSGSGCDGNGGDRSTAPPLRVSKRARQPCGLIPDSVIAKVPRLLMDLETVLGYRVFADEAKARCRELDSCGEGLSQQELCDSLVSRLLRQSRDALRDDDNDDDDAKKGGLAGALDVGNGGGCAGGGTGGRRSGAVGGGRVGGRRENGRGKGREQGKEEEEPGGEEMRAEEEAGGGGGQRRGAKQEDEDEDDDDNGDEAKRKNQPPATKRLRHRLPYSAAGPCSAADFHVPAEGFSESGGKKTNRSTADEGEKGMEGGQEKDEGGEGRGAVGGEPLPCGAPPTLLPRQQRPPQTPPPPPEQEERPLGAALTAAGAESGTALVVAAPAGSASGGGGVEEGKRAELKPRRRKGMKNGTKTAAAGGDGRSTEDGEVGRIEKGKRSKGRADVSRTSKPTRLTSKRPRRSSGILPEGVISKVPRLAIDLSTRYGCGVSAERAKAACRELDQCGENLTSEELADACADHILIGGPAEVDTLDGGEGGEPAAVENSMIGAAAAATQLSLPPSPWPKACPLRDEAPPEIPESVIEKVQRLMLDLEMFTRYPVSEEEAKALVRKLDRCGQNLTQEELCNACVYLFLCDDNDGGGGGGGGGDDDGDSVSRGSSSPEGPRVDVRSKAVPTPTKLLPEEGLSILLRLRLGGDRRSWRDRGGEGGIDDRPPEPGGSAGSSSGGGGRGSGKVTTETREHTAGTQGRAPANGAYYSPVKLADNGSLTTTSIMTVKHTAGTHGADVLNGASKFPAELAGNGSNSTTTGSSNNDRVGEEALLARGGLYCEVGEFVVFPTPKSSPVPFLLGKVLGTKVLDSGEAGGGRGRPRTEVTVHWYTPKTASVTASSRASRAAAAAAAAASGGASRAQVAAAAELSVTRYTSGGWSGDFVPREGTKRLRMDTGEEDLAAAIVTFPKLLQSNATMPAGVRAAVKKQVVAAAVAAVGEEEESEELQLR